MKTYMVGGAVRDKLMGHPDKDRDFVVVGATPDDMLALGFKPVGRDFPVFLHPVSGEEYALARTERKTAPGYKGFSIHTATDVTLEQDLARRDVTINAMAEDADGHLIDPFGGRDDLAHGILRHVSTAFVEDPLRVLRVARFAARFDFCVHDDTLQLMREISASGELQALTAERVWQELERALGEPQPRRFFEVLRDCGALAELIPELDRLFGVPQPEEHHPEIDTGLHTLMVLDQSVRLSAEPAVRFAALMHDLGKGTTPPEEWPSHKGHEQRSVELIEQLCQRFKAPNTFRDLAVIVAREHGRVHRARELRAGTIMELLERSDAFRRPDRFEKVLLACEADARGRTGYEDRDYPQATLLREALGATLTIDVGALQDQGLKGTELGNAIRLARCERIAKRLHSD